MLYSIGELEFTQQSEINKEMYKATFPDSVFCKNSLKMKYFF